jgi:hypothetical protein
MTPMQYELHEARKDRLKRMNAWRRDTLPPIRRQLDAAATPPAQPAKQPKEAPKPEGPTPIHEIEGPIIREGDEPRIEQIQQVVAKRYRISLGAIKSDSRNQFIMLPRQIGYALARRLTSKSFPTIGRAFGGRDHTTVMHGTQKIEERASRDPMFAAELQQLEQIITGKTNLPCPCCGSVSNSLAPTRPDNNDGNQDANPGQ